MQKWGRDSRYGPDTPPQDPQKVLALLRKFTQHFSKSINCPQLSNLWVFSLTADILSASSLVYIKIYFSYLPTSYQSLISKQFMLETETSF